MTIAIFCDIPSLWYGAKAGHGLRVDYGRLRAHLVGDRTSLAVNAFLTDREGIGGFERALNYMGFGTTIIPAGQSCDGYIVRAATACEADTIVIAGGGGQYEALFSELNRLGKTIEVHAFQINAVNWQPYVTKHTLPLSVLENQSREAG